MENLERFKGGCLSKPVAVDSAGLMRAGASLGASKAKEIKGSDRISPLSKARSMDNFSLKVAWLFGIHPIVGWSQVSRKIISTIEKNRHTAE